MDDKKTIKKLARIHKAVGIIAALIISLVVALFVYLQAQSPIYLFVNDTSSDAHLALLGPTSPVVHVDLAPGEKQYVDMPFWWGEPELPRDSTGRFLKPKFNLVIFKAFYLSTFPEDWRN